MQNNVAKKTLVFVVAALFIGIAVQPGISTNTIPKEEKTDVEPKDYLFQTILDIANNPEVKDLFEKAKNNGNFISYDYDTRSVLLKVSHKKPWLFASLLFTRPTISYRYLDLAYRQGSKILDIIGEEEALRIINSTNITDPLILNSFSSTIYNNEELPGRITKLIEMSAGENICIMLMLLFLATIPLAALAEGITYFPNNPVLGIILTIIGVPFIYLALIFLILFVALGCDFYVGPGLS